MKTYCNPLPLPDYPRGRFSHNKEENGWRCEERPDFRELADPSVLYWEGKWYLYPSGRMAYVTEDFVTWHWQRIEPEDTGYAPTIVRHRDHFLLNACGAPFFRAPHPLGPFEEIGRLCCPDGSAPPSSWLDPMLFADPDGNWQPVLDCSRNATDLLIDYRELPPFTTKRVRLEITRPPARYGLGLTAITAFGECAVQ